eukprot:543303-Rhodomonas_salina.1
MSGRWRDRSDVYATSTIATTIATSNINANIKDQIMAGGGHEVGLSGQVQEGKEPEEALMSKAMAILYATDDAADPPDVCLLTFTSPPHFHTDLSDLFVISFLSLAGRGLVCNVVHRSVVWRVQAVSSDAGARATACAQRVWAAHCCSSDAVDV